MPKKSLGQHWLKDREILGQIADSADLKQEDTVLEIGPGLGTLTSELLRRAQRVVAVELDQDLARKLPGQFPGKNLEVVNDNILEFDLDTLPKNYKVVANVPYYITSKIIQKLMQAQNAPQRVTILVQKEVAERLAAKEGEMNILAISALVYSEIELGVVVPAKYFTPPPKVDSQVVILTRRPEPLVNLEDEKLFFQLVKAGFSAKRKKIQSSLAGGLGISKDQSADFLAEAKVLPDKRAQNLSIDDWLRLVGVWRKFPRP